MSRNALKLQENPDLLDDRIGIIRDSALCRAFLVERRGQGAAIAGKDTDPRRSTKNVLD
jgi:hypothetical protein